MNYKNCPQGLYLLGGKAFYIPKELNNYFKSIQGSFENYQWIVRHCKFKESEGELPGPDRLFCEDFASGSTARLGRAQFECRR